MPRTFGIVLVAPCCEKSRMFCQIAKSEYLNLDQINYIQKLGYEIKVVKE